MPTVMIAEDDLLMADMLSDILVQNGYEVCGIARTVDKAVELGECHKPDFAILDIGLANGELGTDIPARLKNIGRMGVLYASGHVGQMGLTKADGEAILSKPYSTEDVLHGLKVVEQIVSTDEATKQCPTGFLVLDDAPKLNTADAEVFEENRKIRRQQAELVRFGLFALAERDLGNVLAEAARVCAECFEVPYCTIHRYRNESNDLITEAGVGWNQGMIGRVVSPLDNSSPQGRAFISRKPVVCGDLSKDSTFIRSSLYIDASITATLNVVIPRSFDAFRLPYGVLTIDSAVPRHYDSCDVDFLTGIAIALGQAVDSTRRKTALQIADDRSQDMVDDRIRFLATHNALLGSSSLLLNERTLLVRDMLHRIRNNFQLIYGMLNNQLQIATDTVQARNISGIARRVMTLAQIHDAILNTGLNQTIDFGVFLPSLCSSFGALEVAEHPHVKLACNCEHVYLDLDTLTAVSLAITELVQNSYTHTFPKGGGLISVALSAGQSGEDTIIVLADNGVGLLEPDGNNLHGLGFVNRLMEQLGGSATCRSGYGTEWTLKFPAPLTPSVNQETSPGSDTTPAADDVHSVSGS